MYFVFVLVFIVVVLRFDFVFDVQLFAFRCSCFGMSTVVAVIAVAVVCYCCVVSKFFYCFMIYVLSVSDRFVISDLYFKVFTFGLFRCPMYYFRSPCSSDV